MPVTAGDFSGFRPIKGILMTWSAKQVDITRSNLEEIDDFYRMIKRSGQ
jgi:hypothetical protein